MPKLKIVDSVSNLIKELGSLPQFYGEVFITNDEAVAQLTRKFEENLLKDIISEIVSRGFSIDENLLNQEIESIHESLFNLVLLFKNYRKPLSNIPDDVIDNYWKWTKTGDSSIDWQKVCISQNKLLNFRLCCIEFSNVHKLSIEFND